MELWSELSGIGGAGGRLGGHEVLGKWREKVCWELNRCFAGRRMLAVAVWLSVLTKAWD